MARRARFGRQVRIQPSIDSTLVAISREMIAREDSNIMDAWKNGGEFEGKKVTDQMVLDHWKMREANLDHNDPLYDTYQDQILQLRYGIEQSKADLQHVQGKLSDSAYAQFFLKWSKKAPRNSEWWRTLQKDAAQLLESAKQRGQASADAAKRKQFEAFYKDQSKDIDVGNQLTAALQAMSKETGLNISEDGDRLLALVSQDYKSNPDKYHALKDALTAAGDGDMTSFTHAYLTQTISNTEAAYDKVATRAHKDGYASDYAKATDGQAAFAEWGQNAKVWSVSRSYDRAMAIYNRTMQDPNASIADRTKARQDFANTARELAKTPGIDVGTVTMLNADADRALGGDGGNGPGFSEGQLGRKSIVSQDMGNAALDAARTDLMRQNPNDFTYAPTDKQGNFDATGKGPVGIVPKSDVPATATYVAVPGLDGTARMVAIAPTAVLAKDPSDPNAKPVVVGSAISYQVGGQPVTLYSYKDGLGAVHWTQTSPWADGASADRDKDGNVVLTLPPPSQAVTADTLESKYGIKIKDAIAALPPGGTAFADSWQGSPRGGARTHIKVSYKDGVFTVSQSSMVRDPNTGALVEGAGQTINPNAMTEQDVQRSAVSPGRISGGDIPGSTFNSAAAASVYTPVATMSNTQIADLSNDPNFQHAFYVQTMNTLGTQDPNDPRIKQAWDDATAHAREVASIPFHIPQPGDRLPNGKIVPDARTRTDLTYPGQPPFETSMAGAPTAIKVGTELTLPKVPGGVSGGPMGSATAAPGLNGFAGQNALPFATSAPGAPAAIQFNQTSVTPTAAPPTSSPSGTTVTGATGAPGSQGGPGVTPPTQAPKHEQTHAGMGGQ